jgi:hypothetical protein
MYRYLNFRFLDGRRKIEAEKNKKINEPFPAHCILHGELENGSKSMRYSSSRVNSIINLHVESKRTVHNTVPRVTVLQCTLCWSVSSALVTGNVTSYEYRYGIGNWPNGIVTSQPIKNHQQRGVKSEIRCHRHRIHNSKHVQYSYSTHTV